MSENSSKSRTTQRQEALTQLTQLQLDILFTAVRIARDENVRNVRALTSRLKTIWPNKPKSICAALTYWANYEAAKSRVGL